jgi:hypothetical protein
MTIEDFIPFHEQRLRRQLTKAERTAVVYARMQYAGKATVILQMRLALERARQRTPVKKKP